MRMIGWVWVLVVMVVFPTLSFGATAYYVHPKADSACHVRYDNGIVYGRGCDSPCTLLNALQRASKDGDDSIIYLCTDSENYIYEIDRKTAHFADESCNSLDIVAAEVSPSKPYPVIIVKDVRLGDNLATDTELWFQTCLKDDISKYKNTTLTIENVGISMNLNPEESPDKSYYPAIHTYFLNWGKIYLNNVGMSAYLNFKHPAVSPVQTLELNVSNSNFNGYLITNNIKTIKIRDSIFRSNPLTSSLITLWFNPEDTAKPLEEITITGNTFEGVAGLYILSSRKELEYSNNNLVYYKNVYITNNTFKNIKKEEVWHYSNGNKTTLKLPYNYSFLFSSSVIGGGLYIQNNQFINNQVPAKIYHKGDVVYNGPYPVRVKPLGCFPATVDIKRNSFSGIKDALSIYINQGRCVAGTSGQIHMSIYQNTFENSTSPLNIFLSSSSSSSTVDVVNNEFRSNKETALNLYAENKASVRVGSNEFVQNEVTATSRFCASAANIYSDGKTSIVNNKFQGNITNKEKGSTLCVNVRQEGLELDISGNEFINNTANVGGGIFLDASGIIQSSKVTVERNKFISNKAQKKGGCIYIESSGYAKGSMYAYFRSNVFYDNEAKEGCLYIATYDGMPQNFSSMTRRFFVVNNTFYKNRSTYGNAGNHLYIDHRSDTLKDDTYLIQNNIFWGSKGREHPDVYIYTKTTGNTDAQYEVSLINNIFSCKLGDCAFLSGAFKPATYEDEYNFVSDPLFQDPLNGNLKLRAISPAIDRGKNTPTPFLPDKDAEGKARVIDGNNDGLDFVDIGAYEYGASQGSNKSILTVNLTNSCGNVNSAPTGITNCSGSCSEPFATGSHVMLTASTPFDNCEFTGWGGDCSFCGSNPSCILKVSSDKECIANFEAYPIGVGVFNALPAVSLTATPTSGEFPLEVEFSCTANDADDGVFEIRWDFDGNGVIDEIYKPMLSGAGFAVGHKTKYTYTVAGSYTAKCIAVDGRGGTTVEVADIEVRLPSQFKVDVARLGNGMVSIDGITCDRSCSTYIDIQGSVNLRADAPEGYSFKGWGGDCSSCGESNVCTLEDIGKEVFCTANFVRTAPQKPNNPPNVSISADTTSGNAPLEVKLTCSATDPEDDIILTYTWDIDNDGIIDRTTNSNEISVTYSNGGVYQAVCTAEDFTGASATSSPVEIRVNDENFSADSMRRLKDGGELSLEYGVITSFSELESSPCSLPQGANAASSWIQFEGKVDEGMTGVWITVASKEYFSTELKVGKCTRSGFKYVDTVFSGRGLKFFVKDGGELDYDGKVDGYVKDPLILVSDRAPTASTPPASGGGAGGSQPSPEPTPPASGQQPPQTAPVSSGGGGGGCSTGGISLFWFLLAASIPLLRRLRD